MAITTFQIDVAIHKERVHWGNVCIRIVAVNTAYINADFLFSAMDDSLRHRTEFVIMQFVSPHFNIKEQSLPWLIRLCTKTENTESLCQLARSV